jgi:hypothetical protein
MMVMLTLVGMASADNLTIEKVKIKSGGKKQIAISLKNPNKQYEAFQFDLVLPDGVSIAKNGNSFIASLNGDRKEDHSLSVKLQEDKSYRLMSYSLNDMAYKGTDGVLVYVTLEANASLSLGDKDIFIKSQVLTDITGEVLKWEDTSSKIEIVKFYQGDASGDGDVTEADVKAVAKYIMGQTPTGFDMEAADVNGDQEINAADIVEIVKIIK